MWYPVSFKKLCPLAGAHGRVSSGCASVYSSVVLQSKYNLNDNKTFGGYTPFSAKKRRAKPECPLLSTKVYWNEPKVCACLSHDEPKKSFRIRDAWIRFTETVGKNPRNHAFSGLVGAAASGDHGQRATDNGQENKTSPPYIFSPARCTYVMQVESKPTLKIWNTGWKLPCSRVPAGD